MYFDWEIEALIDGSSNIEGPYALFKDRELLFITIRPGSYMAVPLSELKVIIHPIMGGKHHPMYNEAEHILFFATETQLQTRSSKWDIPNDLFYHFITKIIERQENEEELPQTVEVTIFPEAVWKQDKNYEKIRTNKNIGVATKSNLGIKSPGGHLSYRGLFFEYYIAKTKEAINKSLLLKNH